MFKNTFSMEGILWQIINTLINIIILNVLFLICSIPLFTIGASSTALYTVSLKLAANEEPYIFKTFFKAFASNFKQGTVIWLICLVLGLSFAGDIRLIQTGVLHYVFIFLLLYLLLVLSYVFPILSKFDNTIKNTLFNALCMGIRHFLPWSLLILLCNAIPFIVYGINATTLYFILPIMVTCGFSVIAYINSKLFNHIFKKYI